MKMKPIRKRIAQVVTFLIIFSMIVPMFVSTSSVYAADPVNLALNKTVTTDSENSGAKASNIVDGDAATYWRLRLASDVTANRVRSVEIDLMKGASGNIDLDKVVLKGLNISVTSPSTSPYLIAFSVSVRPDGSQAGTGTVVAQKLGSLAQIETIAFAKQTARYVKVTLTIDSSYSSVKDMMSEVEIYNNGTIPQPPDPNVLDSVYFAGYASGGSLPLNVGQSASLQLQGVLGNGQPAAVNALSITYSSSNPAIASIDGSGQVVALAGGSTTIQGSATLNDITKTASLQVNVTLQQSGTVLSAVYMYDSTVNKYPDNGTLRLSPGKTHQISVKGIQVDQATADLSNAVVEFISGDPTRNVGNAKQDPQVIQVSQSGQSAQVTAIGGTGTRYIDVKVTKEGVTKTSRIWIDVFQPDTDMTKVNLALLKTVTGSTYCGDTCAAPTGTYDYYAVDGLPKTYWRALSGDYNDNKQHDLTVDFGRPTDFNKAVLLLNNVDIKNYELYYSNDGQTWTGFYQNKVLISNSDTALFTPITARYLKVNLWALAASKPLIYELEVYRTNEAPVPPITTVLSSIYLYDQTVSSYVENAEIRVPKGSTGQLLVGGKMFDNTLLNLDEAQISFTSGPPTIGFPEVAKIGPDGAYHALAGGVIPLTATVTHGPVTKSTTIFLVVQDDAERIAGTGLKHATMKSIIGTPAFVNPGDSYPSVTVDMYVNVQLTGQVRKDGQTVVHQFDVANLAAGTHTELTIPGTAAAGFYEVDLQIVLEDGKTVHDKLYFTVIDLSQIPSDQSQIAYLGTDHKMVYVPDYRGNRIIDFSNVGYMGGGVKIPDVQARVSVEPGEGDDTARIQAAIDFVSYLPVQADGFRGAVLLKKGTYDIFGELIIRQSGIVLRGEDEEETILKAQGVKRDFILSIGYSTDPIENASLAPVLLDNTVTKITDLYVPAGNRTFHVLDASGYKVGDKIMVRRYGNSSWIHEINMDQIPPSSDEVIIQWAPFMMDFDRVVTNVNGNEITVDAPVANAIELQWGGGDIRKYDDRARIEQVGVEKLRVDVVYDPTVTATHSTAGIYPKDENKPESFARFEYVKNGWLRNVKAEHLEYALVQTGRNSKWITVQDAQATEMVSVITGSRRYPFFDSGQLALTQRVYADKVRHAFIVNSRVAGPNVYTDSSAGIEYAESEPHHRWSVGGLFDNLQANVNIMDRSNYGTGHGWAGANYVVWNHTGDLGVQKPPTAQNYAIGLEGKRYAGDYGQALGTIINNDGVVVPNINYGNGKAAGNDPTRFREQGYWEKQGSHVAVPSLYSQQLKDRLGLAAVDNIKVFPVGGGSLDIPQLPEIPENPGNDGDTDQPSDGHSSNVTAQTQPIVDSEGKAKIRIDLPSLEAAGSSEGVIKLEVPKVEGAKSYVIGLPKTFFDKQISRSIEIHTELGTVRLPSNLLSNRSLGDGEDVEFAIKPVNKDLLSADIKKAIGNHPVVDLEVSMNGILVPYNNPDAPVRVSLSYTPTSEEALNPDHIVVWYLNDSNQAEVLQSSKYNPSTELVTFTTTHFSKFAVTYVTKTFDDLHQAVWAQKPIEALASKGIIHGVSERSFAPQAQITRADFVVLLIKALGLTTSTEGRFEDVQAKDYYYDAVSVAKALSIIDGRGPGRFDPKAFITRQEMMTITARALVKAKQFSPASSVLNDSGDALLASFEDRSMLAPYAKEAVISLIKAGYITGDVNRLHPADNTTRAETAVLMYRLVNDLK